ncbi:hypothetical protein BT93_H1489 [Corymbia citriodora subsp. variegata]|nr:hypothetical protein BT93_H1489 [Corymbia citriodora subsp. variegata]
MLKTVTISKIKACISLSTLVLNSLKQELEAPGALDFGMASKRIDKELKDLQKDPPISCSAGLYFEAAKYFSLIFGCND